jgi:acyl carrier protein phosphodiesterase
MNFLAHAYLSGNDEKLLVGNFIADFVKGKSALNQYQSGIRNGILLHRAIDSFTDTHPTVALSKDRLRSKYRHYAGVIVDVFYDHFLARNWNRFHALPLEQYAVDVYRIIDEHHETLPLRVQEFFPYMKRGNWLVNYSRVEGIGRALSGMSRRTPYESKMDESVNDLIQHQDEFESEFNSFFPELQIRAAEFIRNEII